MSINDYNFFYKNIENEVKQLDVRILINKIGELGKDFPEEYYNQ